MKLKRSTLEELKHILIDEYGVVLDNNDIEVIAKSLVGYFDVLLKIRNRHEFGNSPDGVIDSRSESSDKGKKYN